MTNSSQEPADSKEAINSATNVPNLSSRSCFVSILALGLLLEEARLLPRLAGGGRVRGVVDAWREGRLQGREDARAFGNWVDTDKGADLRAALVATLRLIFVPLVVEANEEVLIRGAGAMWLLVVGVPNFFGGKEGSRAISGTGTST